MTCAQVSSANNSFPGTPQKPDDVANDRMDDVKATIAEAQASHLVPGFLPAFRSPFHSVHALVNIWSSSIKKGSAGGLLAIIAC